MIKNFKVLCTDKNFKALVILFFGLILAAFIELIGIGSIPVFVMLITDIDLLKSKLSNFINLDVISGINSNDLVFYGAICLTLIFFVKNVYLALILYFQGVVYKNLRIDVEAKLFSLYINVYYGFHLQNNPAILLRNINSETSQAISVIQSFVGLFRELLVLIVIFALLFFADPLISSAVFLFLSIFVVIFYLFTNKKILKNAKIIQFTRGEIVKHINQSFGAIKEVTILNKESYLYNIFKKNINIFEKAHLLNYFLSTLPRLFLEVIVISSIIIITTILIFLDRAIINMIPLLSLLVIASIRLMPSFNTISTSLARIRDFSPSYNLVVREILKLEKENIIEKKRKIIEEINFSKELKFNNLSFKYEKADTVSVDNINLSIKAGSKIGIIGNSGAGKSTLVDLLLGLLKPTVGSIETDGVDIYKNIHAWQNLTGYVPQDIYLLDDTIKKNIAFGIADDFFDSKKFERAIQISQLQDFVKNLSLGVDTVVGNRGVRISGGQRQRIGIARALYNNQKILILDEATNSLDLENEKNIIDNIFSFDKSKTLILVAHRHETVKKCDEVLLMNKGKLIDKGKYDYLNDKYNLTLFIEKKTKKFNN